MVYWKWSAYIVIAIITAIDLYVYINRDNVGARSLTGCLPPATGTTGFIFLLAVGIIGWIKAGSALYMIFPAIGLFAIIIGIFVMAISAGLF